MPIATAVNTEQYALKLSTSPDVCTRTHYFVFLRDIIETVTSQNFQQKNSTEVISWCGYAYSSVYFAKLTLPIHNIDSCLTSGRHQTMPSCMCCSAVAST